MAPGSRARKTMTFCGEICAEYRWRCRAITPAFGAISEDFELGALYDVSMNEAITIAKARGISTKRFAERGQQFFAQSSSASKPSLLLDLQRGNHLGVDSIAGTSVRLGRKLNITTPVN
jgi:ketopantoate reductase